MNRLSKKTIVFAVSLSALAGCVDAIGFLQLGGYFISFMSGNSTQLAVNLVGGHFNVVWQLGGILILFVCGTVMGTLIAHKADTRTHFIAVLWLVAALLLMAAICASIGWATFAVTCMTLAMGAENAAFQRDGDVIVGLTYMTGTLVKMGQRIAYALLGKDKLAWLPYLFLWFGLIMGGASGALLFYTLKLQSLWLVAAWAITLAVAAKSSKAVAF